MTNSHKRQCHIRKMRINGVWTDDDSSMRKDIASAFQALLSDLGDWRASIEGLSFNRINELEASSLEVPFWAEEVFHALSDLNGDKAPGPDGLTTAFWQHTWDIEKEDVMRMFKDFFETRKFVRSLNTTFLVLIPKKGGAEDFKDFRPISLVGSLYKLLAKVLANRLKRVMDKLVNKAQNAFVEGRQILDAS